jgi:hypothetical protein
MAASNIGINRFKAYALKLYGWNFDLKRTGEGIILGGSDTLPRFGVEKLFCSFSGA